MRTLALLTALAIPCAALAQAPRAPEPAPQRPDIARSMCEALGGAERERCFAELKPGPGMEKGDAAPQGGAQQRTCDDLPGPEKEACLKQGGRIKAGSGATRPSPLR